MHRPGTGSGGLWGEEGAVNPSALSSCAREPPRTAPLDRTLFRARSRIQVDDVVWEVLSQEPLAPKDGLYALDDVLGVSFDHVPLCAGG